MTQTDNLTPSAAENTAASPPIPSEMVPAQSGLDPWLYAAAAVLVVAVISLYYLYPAIRRHLPSARRAAAELAAKLAPADEWTPFDDIPGAGQPEFDRTRERMRAHQEATYKTTAREYNHSRSSLVWHITRFLTQADSEEAIRQVTEDESFLGVDEKGRVKRLHLRVLDDHQLRMLPPELRASIASGRTRRFEPVVTIVPNGSNGAHRPPPPRKKAPAAAIEKAPAKPAAAEDEPDLLDPDGGDA